MSAKAQSHGGVDMGMGLTWATENIGASSPTDSGEYFAFTTDDIAAEKWGDDWRTPTMQELNILTMRPYEWTWDEARNGWVVTYKKNGNSIFFPAAGYYNEEGEKVADPQFGKYWSKTWVSRFSPEHTVYPEWENPNSWLLLFGDVGYAVVDDSRQIKCPIRAVKGELTLEQYHDETTPVWGERNPVPDDVVVTGEADKDGYVTSRLNIEGLSYTTIVHGLIVGSEKDKLNMEEAFIIDLHRKAFLLYTTRLNDDNSYVIQLQDITLYEELVKANYYRAFVRIDGVEYLGEIKKR